MEIAMKRASFLDAVKTVLFGFIGVRKRADHERVKLNPGALHLHHPHHRPHRRQLK